MIVKRNFSLAKVWKYIKKPMLLAILWSSFVWGVYTLTNTTEFYINFTPIGVLGSALAIFIAFRNSSSYGRWWEARKIWGGIVNSSRVLARLIITFTDSHAHQQNYDQDRSNRFKSAMVLKCVAWVNALRLHLRNQDSWEELKQFLSPDEYLELVSKQNKPMFLQLQIGRDIYKAMSNGTLGGFDSFQMEGQMLALANYQGAAERIKNTPLPKQYDFFTRIFVSLFTILLPFGMLSFFQTGDLPSLSWMVVPLSILISGVFIIMERTGAANEDPFENQVTDIPMTALCNTIERDLKEMLEYPDIPVKVQPKDGYLF